MSTALIVGILIVLLVFGVPILQAGLRGLQRRRSLSLDGVPALAAAGLRAEELPSGLKAEGAAAVTSEELAFASEVPEATIAQLDAAGRVIGYRESFRDPRSWGELADVVLQRTLWRNRTHRRIELELTQYRSSEQAEAALEAAPLLGVEGGVEIEEGEERSGAKALVWTRREGEEVVQRMLELRWAVGDVTAVLRGDSEPLGGIADEDVVRLVQLVKGRLR